MHGSYRLVVITLLMLSMAGCATSDMSVVEQRANPVPRANQQVLMAKDGSSVAQSILPKSQVQVNLPRQQQADIFGPFGAVVVVRIANSGQNAVEVSPDGVSANSGGRTLNALPHAEFNHIKAEYEENSEGLRTADGILGGIGIFIPGVVKPEYVGLANAATTVAQGFVRAKLISSEDMTASAAAAFEALQDKALQTQLLPPREIAGGIVVVRDLKPNSSFTLTVSVAGEKHVFSFEPVMAAQ